MLIQFNMKPICENEHYLDFRVKKSDCSKYRIFTCFSEIPLKEWTNIQSLIKADKRSSNSTASIQKYINCLEKVSTEMVKHPYVQYYANKAKKYLKTKAPRIYTKKNSRREKCHISKVGVTVMLFFSPNLQHVTIQVISSCVYNSEKSQQVSIH